MNTRNRTGVLAVAVALIAAFIYPASANQQLTKKWFPGHYLNSGFNHASDGSSYFGIQIRQVLAENPGFVGVKIRPRWTQLETAFGVYDFSALIADLDYAHSRGLKVKLQISDRAFDSEGKGWPLPAYMATDPIYAGGTYRYNINKDWNQSFGTYPKLWNRAVVDRWVALWTAVGQAIDSHPALALVTVEESSLPGQADVEDFNSTALLNNLIHMHSEIADAFPNTPYTPMLNWLGGLTKAQAETMMTTLVGNKKIGMDEPDTYKERTSFTKSFGEYWMRYQGIIPFSGEAQPESYRFIEERENNTAQGVFDFVVDGVKMNFYTWANVKSPTFSGLAFDINDVIAVLEQENYRINTTPPSQLLVGGAPILSPENLRLILE